MCDVLLLVGSVEGWTAVGNHSYQCCTPASGTVELKGSGTLVLSTPLSYRTELTIQGIVSGSQ